MVYFKAQLKMGRWKLEVFRMALYMTFPVAMFHIFNQPKYFEEWVVKTRRDLYPPESLGHHEAIQELIKEIREREGQRMLLELDQQLEKTKKVQPKNVH